MDLPQFLKICVHLVLVAIFSERSSFMYITIHGKGTTAQLS